ncbi:MAG: hypothetical protein AAGF47_12615 [Planctomycetota bacterium]
MSPGIVDSERSWYSVSRKLLAQALGIALPDESQDGIAEFASADRIDEFCSLYLEHPDLHPIARAECVEAVLTSLSQCIEQGTSTSEIYERAQIVVLDAQHNPWALRHLIPLENLNPAIDPGDHAVSMWLQGLNGLELKSIRVQTARLNDPTNHSLD